MPDSVKGLLHVEKDSLTILLPLKRRGDGVYNTMTLLNGRMKGPKTELVIREEILNYGTETPKKKLFKYFPQDMKEANRMVGRSLGVRMSWCQSG